MAAAAIPFALSAASQVVGGIEQNSAAKRGAAIDEHNANLSALSAEQDAQRLRHNSRQEAGDLLVQQGSAGTIVGAGSGADILAQQAYQREVEILNIRTQGAYQAQNFKQAADDKRRVGRSALINSTFGAISSVIGGASAIRNKNILSGEVSKQRAAQIDSFGNNRSSSSPAPRRRLIGPY